MIPLLASENVSGLLDIEMSTYFRIYYNKFRNCAKISETIAYKEFLNGELKRWNCWSRLGRWRAY